MTTKFVLIPTFMLLLSSAAFGENSVLSSNFSQLSQGRICGPLSQLSKNETVYLCTNKKNNLAELFVSGQNTFEKTVFNEAIQNQLAKNKCVQAQTSLLIKDPQALSVWKYQLTQAWLGKRKSELILDKCMKEVEHKIDLKERMVGGLGSAYKKAMQDEFALIKTKDTFEKNPWDEICNDKSKMAALKAAHSIFTYTLPVISSPELLDLVEKNRDIILNKKSGKPLADIDILNSNLSDLSFDLKDNKSFDESILKIASTANRQRAKVTAAIEEMNKKNESDADTDLKDYIFNDDTLYQTLENNKLLDQKKPWTEQSSGVFCLMSKYEPSFSGDLFDLSSTAFLSGGVLLKAFKSSKYLAGLSEMRQAENALLAGFELQAARQSVNQFINACLSDLPALQKSVSAKKNERNVSRRTVGLANNKNQRTWSLAIDPKKIPDCDEASRKNLIANADNDEAGCMISLLLGISPLRVSIPTSYFIK